jgi:hypothetical protein
MSDWGRETVIVVAIDQPFCTRTWGDFFVSPTPAAGCHAVLGVDDDAKCFHTFATCPVQDDFDEDTLTLRFARSQSEIARYYGFVRPFLLAAPDTAPGVINLGGMDQSAAALGQRESITLVFSDHLDSDLGVDPYRRERQTGEALAGSPSEGYDSYTRGTFWGKWLARNPYYIGYPLRVYEGYVGQDLEDMRVRHYVIDKIDGPNNGQVTIVAKDAFALVELSKAVIPAASRGELASDLAADGGSFTLSPSGIGNEEYEASGYFAIGDEIIQGTRSGDTVTVAVNGRGALGTTASAHDEEDLVQQVAVLSADLAQNHIYNLLTEHTAVGASRINQAEWAQITAAVDRLFSVFLAKPTPVEQVIGEFLVAAGLTVWPDVSDGMIKIAVLRAGAAVATVSDEAWILGDAVRVVPLVDKRASQVHGYYGQKNPLVELKDKRNYHSRFIPTFPNNYATESIREVFLRVVPQFAREHAEETCNRLTAMFKDPPKQATFTIHASRDGELDYARYFKMSTRELQDKTGARDELTSFAVVSIERGENSIDIVGQSARFAEEDGGGSPGQVVRNIFIENDANDVNLRAVHDSQFATPTGTETIIFHVESDVVVGSTSTGSPAVRTGAWPDGVTLQLVNNGRIQGKGGAGGTGSGGSGSAGGTAFLAEYPISIDNTDGELWGGGGGGGAGGFSTFPVGVTDGGSGGGGGAGTQAGGGGSAGAGSNTSGNPGSPGSSTAGGAGGSTPNFGGSGGAGGGPGEAGSAGQPGSNLGAPFGGGGSGGGAGNYLTGNSFVTWIATGDRRGGVS